MMGGAVPLAVPLAVLFAVQFSLVLAELLDGLHAVVLRLDEKLTTAYQAAKQAGAQYRSC